MAIATLSIDLEARLARLEGDLGRATALVERQSSRMESSFTKASTAAKGIGAGIISGLGTVQFAQFIQNTLNSVDALNDFADATGTTIERASALEQVGLRTGTTLDTISAAVVKLNQGLATGNEDSPTAKALTRIGLSANELRQLDPADALKRVADALAGFADDGDKARLVQDLFGKSVREVAPLLKDLNEQGELAGRITKAQADEVDKLNKAIFQLQGSFTNLSREILGAVVPSLNEVFARIKAGQEVFGSFGATIRAGLGNKAFSEAGEGVQFYTDRLERLRATRDIVAARGGSDPFRGNLADLDKEIAAAQKLEQFYRRSFALTAPDLGQSDARELARRGRVTALPSIGAPPADTGARGGRGSTPRVSTEFTGPQLPEALANALKRIEQTDTARLSALREQLAALVQLTTLGDAGAAAALPGLVEEIAALDPAGKAAAQGLTLAAEQAQRLNALLADTADSKIKAVTSDIEFLNEQFAAGNIANVEQWAEAVRKATGRIGEATEKTKEADGLARDLGLTFSSAAEDAIVKFESLSDVLKGLEQDLLRILARKFLTEPLANGIEGILKGFGQGQGGGFGGFLAGLLGSANGNAFGPSGLITAPGLMAYGSGSIGKVGERGEEAILPLQRGRDGRLGVASAGGGRVTNITVNVQAQPGMSRETALQQGATIGRGIQQALARNG